MKGISLGKEEDKMGQHSSSTRVVTFDEVKVPVENLLGGRGNGFKIALNCLNVGRIKIGSAEVEKCKTVISQALQYAMERKQFK